MQPSFAAPRGHAENVRAAAQLIVDSYPKNGTPVPFSHIVKEMEKQSRLVDTEMFKGFCQSNLIGSINYKS